MKRNETKAFECNGLDIKQNFPYSPRNMKLTHCVLQALSPIYWTGVIANMHGSLGMNFMESVSATDIVYSPKCHIIRSDTTKNCYLDRSEIPSTILPI